MSGADRTRLAPEVLDRLPSDVQRPDYDRDAQRNGIVHFGVGAFHRAHQAAFTDDAMAAGDRDWGIVGVSLRSTAVQRQLMPQHGLYSIVERGGEEETLRIAGAVRDVLAGPAASGAIVDAIASPDTRVLSLTITEAGYLRALDGDLDLDHPAIAADRAEGAAPATIYGFVRAGLMRRRAEGLPGLTLLSCDNLATNGAVLSQCLHSFLDATDKQLARWFLDECACPSTMVDRIVPATTQADLAALAERLGVRDEAAVITEPFRQWVIEDRFVTSRPRWEAVGAQLVGDVHAYELAKLRLLNAAHSALAYLGLPAGHAYVHEAIADPAIRPVIDRIMRVEAAGTLRPMRGFDPDAYCDRLIERFANARLPHSLAQIAMDGSQKLPQRWLATLRESAICGRRCPAILTALSAWIGFVRGDRFVVADPLSDQLRQLWQEAGGAEIVAALFGPCGLFAEHWVADEADMDWLREAITQQA